MTTSARLPPRLVTVLITLACVVLAAVGIRVSEPDDNFQVVRGTVGAPVSLNEGEVMVSDVRVGDSLFEDGDVTSRTAGMFVAVHVTGAAPDREKLVLGSARLLSGDRVYLPYTLTNLTVVPGFQTSLDLVFEVDPAGIEGLTLELWRGEVVVGYHQRVRVPLGFTRRSLADWRNQAHRPIVEPEIYGETSVIG